MTVSAGVLRAPVSSTFYSFLLVFPPGLPSPPHLHRLLAADFRTGIPEPESLFLVELG